jgi:glycolate oxidase iron-sulfur subunit
MQTRLSPEFKGTRDGDEAEAILRSCVHCGFCTATCPTYQLLGDELDGPRGRIYLIKQVLEGAAPTRSTQAHLDRCLTCRNCESTCPSGVRYGELVEIGRRIVDERVRRPAGERLVRWLLKEGLTSPLFAPAFKAGQVIRPLLPHVLKDKLPKRGEPARRAGSGERRRPAHKNKRKVLVLAGCVQPAMASNINAATARVLEAAGIETITVPKTGCCGAIRSHLGDQKGGLGDMRHNIDAWWPLLRDGTVDAIVVNASGCSLMVKDYGRALAQDQTYATKATQVSALARDLSELLPEIASALKRRLSQPALASTQRSLLAHGSESAHGSPPEAHSPLRSRLVFHPPCTLQHGQGVRGVVEENLSSLGFDITVAGGDSHLCCGSAGTYAVLQSGLSKQLRDRKLAHLEADAPHTIVSANLGCIHHLQSGTATPVKHWVEVLDEALAQAGYG